MGRLQDQMKTDLLLKRYSPHTTRAYLRCVRDFAKHFMRSPAEMEKPKYVSSYSISLRKGKSLRGCRRRTSQR
jgi:hypothetical protein